MTTPNEPKEEQTEKSVYDVAEEPSHTWYSESKKAYLPHGIISFADYDAMEQAQQEAVKVKNDASLFKAMVDNILEIEPTEGMDKSSLIVKLATEFSQRVQQPPETKEDNHLKEVYEDDARAIEDDFGDGCPYCGFVSKEKECPYCHNEVEIEHLG